MPGMGTWNEDLLAALQQGGPNTTANAAALQAIKDATAATQQSNADILAKLPPTVALNASFTAITFAAATSRTVLVAKSTRRGAIFQNESGQTVLLAFGVGASSTQFSVKIVAGGYYELPFGFAGLITGWTAAASTAPGLLVTELT